MERSDMGKMRGTRSLSSKGPLAPHLPIARKRATGPFLSPLTRGEAKGGDYFRPCNFYIDLVPFMFYWA